MLATAPSPSRSPAHPPSAIGIAEQTRALPRIVALGGGTGLPAVVEGLCGHLRRMPGGQLHQDLVTAIVAMTDDGGSSGELRRTFGVLPPGDARNCVLAGLDGDSPFRTLLQHRFERGTPLEGHPVGNLLLTVMSQMTGFADAVRTLSNLVGSRAQVLPVTTDRASLRAELASGAIIAGETAISARQETIQRLSIEPNPRPLPDVMAALLNAETVVVGPGSLYTSVLPTLLVQGIAGTIYGINAVRIYVANLMTQPGETDGFSLDDHLRVIREHTGFDLFDYILVNRQPIDPEILRQYAERGAEPVRLTRPLEWAGRAQVIEADFSCVPGLQRGKIRHDPASLAAAVLSLGSAGRTMAS
jgi:uncharacterized cofD-like protein